MLLNLVMVALAGTAAPAVLVSFGGNVILASGGYVTSVTYLVGFFTFIVLAAWMLL